MLKRVCDLCLCEIEKEFYTVRVVTEYYADRDDRLPTASKESIDNRLDVCPNCYNKLKKERLFSND